MKKYICTVCQWVYDPEVGDPESGIEPGTAFEDIPEDWVCPVCGASKADFEAVEESAPAAERDMAMWQCQVGNCGYIYRPEKGDRKGTERKYHLLTLSDGKISTVEKSEITGADKGKLLPTDIGVVVNDFLTQYFPEILNYNFTASVEQRFDDIAEGKTDRDNLPHKRYRYIPQK